MRASMAWIMTRDVGPVEASATDVPVVPDSSDGGDAEGARRVVIAIAAVFSTLAVCISVTHMVRHATNYRRPDLQRYILRIIFMVVVYATLCFFSIVWLDASTYFDVIREFYEAYAMYTFLSLLECLVGGDQAIRAQLAKTDPMPHLWPMNHCLPKLQPSRPDFILNLRRGVLQLVLVKLVLGFITIILEACNVYYDGHLRLDGGYMYCFFIYNFSISIAMYSLIIFYQAFKEPLKPYKPFPKFLCIKMVIFATFWQGCLLSLLSTVGILKPIRPYTTDDIVTGIQDLLICIEMFFAALAHGYAYSPKEFEQMDTDKLPFNYAVKDTFSGVRDIASDTKVVFNPRSNKRANEYDALGNNHPVGFEIDAEVVDHDDVFADEDGEDIAGDVDDELEDVEAGNMDESSGGHGQYQRLTRSDSGEKTRLLL